MRRWLERLLIVVASLAISIGVIAVLSGGLLAGRDDPGVTTSQNGPGTGFRDQGDLHLHPGELRPVYDSDPPTSGPHIPVAVTRDRAAVSNDQLLQALETGDVVFLYGSPQPPVGLPAIARAVGGPFTPALAASGQAVILARRPGVKGIVALAWTRMLRTLSGPELRDLRPVLAGSRRPAASSRISAGHHRHRRLRGAGRLRRLSGGGAHGHRRAHENAQPGPRHRRSRPPRPRWSARGGGPARRRAGCPG